VSAALLRQRRLFLLDVDVMGTDYVIYLHSGQAVLLAESDDEAPADRNQLYRWHSLWTQATTTVTAATGMCAGGESVVLR
jgi:hypothetical protein